jgi:hypothetical protein
MNYKELNGIAQTRHQQRCPGKFIGRLKTIISHTNNSELMSSRNGLIMGERVSGRHRPGFFGEIHQTCGQQPIATLSDVPHAPGRRVERSD